MLSPLQAQTKHSDRVEPSSLKRGIQGMEEGHYGPVIGNKTIYISHGGKCMMVQNNRYHDLVITEPDNVQSRHEEADTLVAFHAHQEPEGSILVRSTDTDVLVILLGLAGRSHGSNIILDYGSGNHRR